MMANKDDYFTEYRRFFEDFANTVEPNDQLPVKLGSYKFFNSEVIGGIVDWCLQYLNRKSCPSSLVAPLIKMTIDEIRQACKKHPIACGFSPNENVYQPLKLMQTVMNKMNEICLRYLDNSELDKLPAPWTVPPPLVSACATRNIRRRMEDRHVVIHDLNTMFNIQDTSPSSYYAIFDGHAGRDAASYSAAHLHQFLAESEYYPTDPERAFREAFIRTDEFFLEKSKIENFRSGTTAVCALLKPKQKTLYVAWVGDSLALLVNKGKVLQIVNPHKPCREDERHRIQESGGRVLYWGIWRVNGQLAVSRAIGNITLKPYVTAEPDIAVVPLDGNEDFLIMACDGLWDFVSEDDAALAVYNRIRYNPENFDTVAEYLVDKAKLGGSHDNISVIVVFLKDPVQIAKDRAAEWGWAAVAMDTSVDNSNNATNNAYGLYDILQKRGPLLDCPDDYKRNGTTDDKSPSDAEVYFVDRQTNGKRSADEFDEDEDDFGPETDIDAVDNASVSPPIASNKDATEEENANNNPQDEVDRMDTVDIDLELQQQQSNEFEPIKKLREETPTPPADTVLDNSGLAENVAESGEDSEDEWNYYRVDPKQKESSSPVETTEKVSEEQPDQEESEEMSQLNPDAKEFVPVSPTRHTAVSPTYNRDIVDDMLVAQSPRRAVPMDISVPSPVEFQHEVKQRPSEVFDDYSKNRDNKNNHQLSSQELMQNLLNGKDVSEIEFHPSNYAKSPADNHQFETKHSSEGQTDISSVNKPADTGAVQSTDVAETKEEFDFTKCEFIPKEQDPMSMSFYQDKDEIGKEFSTNPFDLNSVQMLPDDSDNESNSDKQEEQQKLIHKSGDNSLAQSSPQPPPQSPLQTDDICELPLTPPPGDVCEVAPSPQQTDVKSVEDENEGPKSPVRSDVSEASKSPLQVDVCELPKSPAQDDVCLLSKSPLPDDICKVSKSPLQDEICELSKSPLQADVCELSKSPLPDDVCEISTNTPPLEDLLGVAKLPTEAGDVEFAKSPTQDILYVPDSPAQGDYLDESAKSPLANSYDVSKSPLQVDVSETVPDIHSPMDLSSPVGPLSPKSPIPELTGLVSPDITASVKDENISGEMSESAKSPILNQPSPAGTPVDDLLKSPDQELEKEVSKSPLLSENANLEQAATPELIKSASPIVPEQNLLDDVMASVSPVQNAALTSEELLPEDEKGITDFTKESLSELVEASSNIIKEISHEAINKAEEVICEVNEDASHVQELLSDAIADITETNEQIIEAKSPISDVCQIKTSADINKEVPDVSGDAFECVKELSLELEVCNITKEDELEMNKEAPEFTKDTSAALEDVYDVSNEAAHVLEHTFEEMEKRATHLIENVSEISQQVWHTMEHIDEEMKQDIASTFDNVYSHTETSNIIDDNLEILDNINSGIDIQANNAKELASELIDEKADVENILETKTETLLDTDNIEKDEFSISYLSNEIIQPTQEIVKETIESVAAVSDEKLNISNVESEVTPSEVNSFLERSLLPEVTSPLSPTENIDHIEQEHPQLWRCVYPLPPQYQNQEEPIQITCQTIEPQYPVPIFASPSEESKGADTPPSTPALVHTEPELQRGSPEPEKIVEAVEKLTEKPAELDKKDDAVLTAAVVAAEVATAGVVAAAATAVVSKIAANKVPAKPKPGAPAKKAPINKSTPTSPTKALPSKTSSTTVKKTATLTVTAPKPAPTKPAAPKPKSTTPTPSPRTTLSAKTTPKAKTPATTPTTRPLSDKKPLTNGDVKAPIKQTLVKKTAPSSVAAKPAPAKLSPTKTTSATSKSTTSVTKTAAPPTKPTTRPSTATSNIAPKARPASLQPKTSTTAPAPKAGTTKTTTTKSTTATTTAPKPRVPLTAASKPRFTLTATKTTAKAPDTEKQIKETANKQLFASRTTSARTTTASATRLSATKKPDAKAPVTKTTMRTTTSSVRSSTTSKKPTEVTRTTVTKTKSTSVPKGAVDKNGVVDVIQQITTVTVVEDEPKLVKDNSPVEPNPLIDNSQLPASALIAD